MANVQVMAHTRGAATLALGETHNQLLHGHFCSKLFCLECFYNGRVQYMKQTHANIGGLRNQVSISALPLCSNQKS